MKIFRVFAIENAFRYSARILSFSTGTFTTADATSSADSNAYFMLETR